MARHKLPAGQEFIQALGELGSTLGYIVKEEHPIGTTERNAPAVDVAWFKEEGAFPLMIFEVESRVTNAVANNALKVYGLSNELFEKPLFFFHILLIGGKKTSRLKTLKHTYDSHNYRTYTIEAGDKTALAMDILSQHRRVESRIDVINLVGVLERYCWNGVDLDIVLQHIESVRFNGNYLPSYSFLALRQSRYLKHYLRSIVTDMSVATRSWKYDTYVGDMWGELIHVGFLALYNDAQLDPLYLLQQKQERRHFKLIAPDFGLSRDHDDFLLGFAPTLLALLASMMYKVPGAKQYILEQYDPFLSKLERAPASTSFFLVAWMIHVAAAANDHSRYAKCAAFIDERGGISLDVLIEPPSSVSFVDVRDDEWIESVQRDAVSVPNMQEFLGHVRRCYSWVEHFDEELTRFVLTHLTSETHFSEWGTQIARFLHFPSGVTAPRPFG